MPLKEGGGAALIADKVLEAIIIATGDSRVAVTTRRTLEVERSEVDNKEALEREEGLWVTPNEVEHMEEMSSSS